MDGAFAAEMAELMVFVAAILILHELAHVVVARVYGYPVLCLAVSPLAIGVVFLDHSVKHYWLLQVMVPMAVTASVTFLGMGVVPLIAPATEFVFGGSLLWQLGLCILLSALTSSGDAAIMAMEFRRPVRGKDRIVRDVRLLKRMGSLIWFTGFGRSYLLREFGLSPRQFVAAAAHGFAARTVPQGS